MTTYQEYKAQIAELEEKATQARQVEVKAAVSKIWEIMDTYNLQISDLGKNVGAKSKTRTAVLPKYRDTATGQEWTGRGRAPRWLDGKNKEEYLIR